MFNTVIQSVSQPTITVSMTPWLPAVATAQHLHPGRSARACGGAVGGHGGGLLVTQPLMANGLQAPSSSPWQSPLSPSRPLSHPLTLVFKYDTAVKVVNAAQSLLSLP